MLVNEMVLNCTFQHIKNHELSLCSEWDQETHFKKAKKKNRNVFQLWIECRDSLESFKNRAAQSCCLLAEASDAHLWLHSAQRVYPSTTLFNQSERRIVCALLHTFPLLLLYPFVLSILSSIPHSLFSSFIFPIVQSACEFITGSRWTLGPWAFHTRNLKQPISSEASLIPSLPVCVNLLLLGFEICLQLQVSFSRN